MGEEEEKELERQNEERDGDKSNEQRH